jgi:hypothetical protein
VTRVLLRGALVGLPLVGVGLGQADVGEDSVNELAGHVLRALRMVVEGRDGGEDGGAGVGGKLHVADVDAVEGCLADAKDEGAIFFEADVGGALDQVGGEAVGDACQGAHGAGEDNHRVGGVAAAGDVRSDVGFGVLLEFGAGSAEEFFGEVVAAAQVEFFGEDAERAVGGDEVDLCDAVVGGEGTEDLCGVDAAAGSGDG